MSLTVGELQVLLSGDPSKLNRELDRIDNRAGQTEKTHSAAWGRIGAAAGAAIKSGMIVATGAVVGLAAAIKQGLNMASFTEQAEISFGTLLGSAAAAKTYMVDLQKFAATTPFELPGVVEGAQKLLGVGAAVETVLPTLTAWGDASGALGLGQEQFGRVLTAVTQMMGKGKVSAEEMLQITEAGIPIWMLLAKATGKPVPELQKLASEGKLLAEDVLPALEAQMNADYGGSMAKQAQTLSGVWSTAKDNLNLALRDGVLPLATGLKTVLPGASAAAATAIRELGLRGSEGLVNLIERGQELREEFGPELSQIADMARQKWDQFVDVAKRLGEELGPSLPDVADALLRIAQVGMDVGAGMMPVLQAAIGAVGPVSEAVAGTLQLVAGALEAIEPILPAVVTGFLAFQGISAVNGLLTGFSGGVKSLSERMSTGAINAGVFTEKLTGSAGAGEKVMTGMGRAAGAVSKIGAALPVVGLAVAAVGYAYEQHAQQVEADTQALLENLQAQGEGGTAAVEAGKSLDAHRQKIAAAKTALENMQAAQENGNGTATRYSQGTTLMAEKIKELQGELDSATGDYNKQVAAMTPMEKAQQRVTETTNNLMLAQDKYGASSPQAAAAAEQLTLAQGRLEQKQRDLDGATRSATSALAEQTLAAMAGANADLAASMAQTGLTTATETFNASLADGTLTTTQRQQATDAMTQASLSAAQAAQAQALAHSTAATDEAKQAEADAALLASLKTTAQQLGVNTPKAISDLIGSLEASAGTAGLMTAKVEELGLTINAVPNEKFIEVNAPTEEQKQRLRDLGYAVTNIPGSKNVIVTADTSPAAAALAALVARNYTINVRAVMPDLASVQTNGKGSTSQRMGSFDSGGYTGGMGVKQVAGIVHGREFVTDADKTARWRPVLEAIHAGNDQAAAMLATSIGGSSGGGVRVGGSAGTGSASVGGVTKIYNLHAAVTHTITLPEFISLQKQADALYG